MLILCQESCILIDNDNLFVFTGRLDIYVDDDAMLLCFFPHIICVLS